MDISSREVEIIYLNSLLRNSLKYKLSTSLDEISMVFDKKSKISSIYYISNDEIPLSAVKIKLVFSLVK